jgi:hypothetical protein
MYLLHCIEPIFDKYGHFYLKHDDHIYEFSINGKDELELFEIFNTDNFKFKIVEDVTNNRSLNLLSNCNTLKGKIIKEYIKEKKENPDEEYESDEELDSNTIQTLNNKIQYNPEDLEYIEEENENNYSDEEYVENSRFGYDSELHFAKYGSEKLRILEEIDDIEITEINGFYNNNETKNFCGYDTYIYDGNEYENKLEYINKISLFLSPNRIFAFKDGSITLKIVGSPKKRYQLQINKETGELFLIKKC